MGTSDDEHGRVSWTTLGDVEQLVRIERQLGPMVSVADVEGMMDQAVREFWGDPSGVVAYLRGLLREASGS